MNKEQGFLLAVLVAAAVASFWMILPVLQYLLLAVILAYMLHPVNRRLTPHLGRRVSPIVVMFAGLVVLILPFLYIASVLYADLREIARGGPDLQFARVEAWIQETTGREIDLAEYFEQVGAGLFDALVGDVTGMVARLTFWLVGLALVLFVVYYLLRDGEAAVDWLIDMMPLDEVVGRRLADQIDKTTRGVILGHLLVALAEGIVGGFAFWVTGIPDVMFWAFVMMIASLLPIVGAFLVWFPAVGYLLIIEEPLAAAFMFLWGAIVITLIDDWVRPILVDREAHLNPAIILIGVIGGIYAIGAIGLFVGPIIIGVLVAAVLVFDEEWERLGEG